MFLPARGATLAILALAVVVPPTATPKGTPIDEGMWPFDHPPLELLKKKYDFEPDRAWFDHLRLSTVRLRNGGSGAYVSADGLVLTNHHLVMRSLQHASNDERDLLLDGFLASKREQELKCEGLSLTVLVESRDVTETLRPATDREAAEGKLLEGLRQDDSEHEFQVQRLFGGEKFVLHRYRRHRDVRLVWAPEMTVGFFGGDDDNFTYPRFCLDVALLRVYEDDKPVHTAKYLRFSKGGAKTGKLVLVSGHPLYTNRRQTLAQVLATRDITYPTVVAGLRARRRALEQFTKLGERQAQAARTLLWSVQNSLKLVETRLAALRNGRLIDRKREAQHALLQTAAGKKVGHAFREISQASSGYAKSYRARWLGRLPGRLATRSRAAAAAARQHEKDPQLPPPNYIELLAKTEIDKKLEETLLLASFKHALKTLGRDHQITKSMLLDKTPLEQARRVVNGSRLHEPEFLRSTAAALGHDGLRSLDDPMLNLHLRLESVMAPHKDTMTQNHRIQEEQLDRIERARYRAYGDRLYPDADGTLRLSFGVVKGYSCDERRVPAKTTIGGLLDRCDSFDCQQPYDLPARFLARRGKLDNRTPLNFVCTADIANGNSGSPVVNRRNELVGVVFDGNLESMGNNFVYDEERARAVCVHSTAILEILEKVYEADHLVKEIRSGND
ncbi:MAG: S46 family peptidase [Planctomycetota bacterium]